MNEQDEIKLVPGDGADQLLTLLYGESSAATIGKAIGGSQARMLFDAAEEIAASRVLIDDQTREIKRLRGIIDSLAARVKAQSDLLTARAERKAGE